MWILHFGNIYSSQTDFERISMNWDQTLQCSAMHCQLWHNRPGSHLIFVTSITIIGNSKFGHLNCWMNLCHLHCIALAETMATWKSWNITWSSYHLQHIKITRLQGLSDLSQPSWWYVLGKWNRQKLAKESRREWPDGWIRLLSSSKSGHIFSSVHILQYG